MEILLKGYFFIKTVIILIVVVLRKGISPVEIISTHDQYNIVYKDFTRNSGEFTYISSWGAQIKVFIEKSNTR